MFTGNKTETVSFNISTQNSREFYQAISNNTVKKVLIDDHHILWNQKNTFTSSDSSANKLNIKERNLQETDTF